MSQLINVISLHNLPSHHINLLIDAGLIEPEKEGRNYAYILNKALLKEYVKEIAAFAGKKLLILTKPACFFKLNHFKNALLSIFLIDYWCF